MKSETLWFHPGNLGNAYGCEQGLCQSVEHMKSIRGRLEFESQNETEIQWFYSQYL